MSASASGLDILRLAALCGSHFTGPSWSSWWVVLKALFGLPLGPGELEVYTRLTGRTAAPSEPAREAWLLCGRRAGKSIIAALVVVFLATCRTYRLAPGEVGVVMLIAADRRQARVLRRYVAGLLQSSPVLAQLVAAETRDAITLTNGIVIEIHTASYRSTRGYTVVAAVCDEVAFWANEDSAEPDREVLAALRPAMATVPDALLLGLTSLHGKRGESYRAHRDHYGKDGDPVLVVQAPTREMNPTVPQSVIDRAEQDDPASAASEFGAQFRADLESYVPREVVERLVSPGRRELPPLPGVRYHAFLDFAGGSGQDSATLAIAHGEQRGEQSVAVLDCVREVRPPFAPSQVCADFAGTLRAYGITKASADRYAGAFPVEHLAKHGVTVEPADKAKSDLYREALPALTSGACELLDDPRLVAQLVGLERRTARGGRDSIDHAPGCHDDLANSVAGALLLASRRPRHVSATWGRAADRQPAPAAAAPPRAVTTTATGVRIETVDNATKASKHARAALARRAPRWG